MLSGKERHSGKGNSMRGEGRERNNAVFGVLGGVLRLAKNGVAAAGELWAGDEARKDFRF